MKMHSLILKRTTGMAAVIALAAAIASCAGTQDGGSDVVSAPSAAIKAAAATETITPLQGAGKLLVVYFSQGETTKTVAEDLAELTGADIERIVESKTRSAGFFGFMGAGAASTFKLPSKIAESTLDPSEYDAVYVCTPVWSWSLSPPVRAWLRSHKGTIKKAAFVTVSGDTEPDKIAKDMAKEAGVQPFAVRGFAERDFKPEGRAVYLEKIARLVDALR